MWDVVWTDPERKSRKDHRDAKVEKKARQARKEAASITTRSISSRSSGSSFKGLNGANPPVSPGRKRAQRNVVSPSSTLSSVPTSPTSAVFDVEADRASIFSVSYELTPVVSPYSPSAHGHPRVSEHFAECGHNELNGTKRDASFESVKSDKSTLTVPPKTSHSSWSTQTVERVALEPHHLVQTLSGDSFIARSTEVTTTTRTPFDTSMAISTEVIITADPDNKAVNRPPSSSAQSQTSSFRGLMSRSAGKQLSLPKMLKKVPSNNSSLRQADPDSWKPPDAWACTPTSETSLRSMEEAMAEATKDSPQSDAAFSSLDSLHQELDQLAEESNRIRLLRLNRVWNTLSGSVHKELSLEEVQWMLSALHNINEPRQFGGDSTGTNKVLALYETAAATSYLAGVHRKSQVYHLSPVPLSPTLFPNIHPVFVPGKSSTSFPLAHSLFETVYSLQLPTLTPSQEIPGILKNIHRCLQLGGSLHLTLVDPLPLGSTLGPLLRAWIEHHLLFNLEANFYCTNPSRLFPIWLKNASLQIDKTSTSTTRFFAVPPDKESLTFTKINNLTEAGINQELRNVLGRMLWMEIWREHIVAESWWWEDPDILDECTNLGTVWEWHEIKACK